MFMRKAALLLVALAAVSVMAASGCTQIAEDLGAGAQGSSASDAAYLALAAANQNETLCARIANPTLRDSCVKDIAMTKRDASLCPTINDTNLRNDCYYIIGRLLYNISNSTSPCAPGTVETNDSCTMPLQSM
jgi:hypothetical protein